MLSPQRRLRAGGLLKHPTFTLVAVLTPSLGIGTCSGPNCGVSFPARLIYAAPCSCYSVFLQTTCESLRSNPPGQLLLSHKSIYSLSYVRKLMAFWSRFSRP